MANGQRTKTGNVSAKKADTLETLGKSADLESMPLGASESSSTITTATTRKGSQKTWKIAELQELKSKIGLVAGALADFQAAGGLVVTKKQTYTVPSGSTYTAIKLFLIVQDANIVAVQTEDGLEFDLVAEQ